MKRPQSIVWWFFVADFIAAHLANLGHQPGSVSEYAVRPLGWLGTLIFLGLAALLLSAAAVVRQRTVGVWGKVGAAFQVLAALLLIGIAFFPTDLPGQPATGHGSIHSVLAPVWVPLAAVGVLAWWLELRSSPGSWFGAGISVSAVAALLLWGFGFVRLPGVVFAIDQRLLFLLIGAVTTWAAVVASRRRQPFGQSGLSGGSARVLGRR